MRSLLVVAAMAFVLVPATPASAHASLLTTTPAAGYSVASGPPALTLVFDQPVSVRGTPLRVDGPGGAVELGAARLSSGDRWLTAAVPRLLARGQYTVTWQVVAEDGDVVGGSYSFAVGTAAAVSSQAAQTRGLPAAAVLRWLLFAALSVGLGGLAGQWVAARVIRKAAAVGRQLAPVRAPVAAASAVGALAALGLSAHVLGGGDVVAGLTHPSINALLASGAGRVSAVEVAAFALAAVLATRPRLQPPPRCHCSRSSPQRDGAATCTRSAAARASRCWSCTWPRRRSGSAHCGTWSPSRGGGAGTGPPRIASSPSTGGWHSRCCWS